MMIRIESQKGNSVISILLLSQYSSHFGVISLNPKLRIGKKTPLQQDIAMSSVSLKWSFCLYGFYFIMVLHIFVC